MNSAPRRVLICADWFDPGVRAGGPIRSCVNLSMILGQSEHVAVLTSDRDLGAAAAYPGILPNRWINWRGKAAVCYCSSTFRRICLFTSITKSSTPTAIYLNSMFSFAGTLFPILWLWLTRSRSRIVLAPRGMLKPSALNQKRWKKQPLISLLQWSGMMRRVVFHATSDEEIREIRDAFGTVRVRKIPNVPCVPVDSLDARKKQSRRVTLTFVGRVHPIKNLLWLLESLKNVKHECQLNVIGPIEDHGYYRQCQDAVEQLPLHVTVNFSGVKSENEVRDMVTDCDAMVLPTAGENFGHAIFEAFASGTPVIISDRTIWRNLREKHAGWDLSLDSPGAFANAIDEVADMESHQHQVWRQGALDTAHEFLRKNPMLEDYRGMFFEA